LQITKKLKEHGYVKQDLSKLLKPAVSKLEREKYAKIREIDIKDNG
jgi:isochorismate synthase EntC